MVGWIYGIASYLIWKAENCWDNQPPHIISYVPVFSIVNCWACRTCKCWSAWPALWSAQKRKASCSGEGHVVPNDTWMSKEFGFLHKKKLAAGAGQKDQQKTIAQPAIFCTDTAYVSPQFLMQKGSTSITESLGWVLTNTNWINVLTNVTSCISDNFSMQPPNSHWTCEKKSVHHLEVHQQL